MAEQNTTVPASMDSRWNQHRKTDGARARQEQLRQRLAGIISQEDFEIPPLPEVAVELQRLVDSPVGDATSAVSIVKRDAQLTTRVMKLACSPVYRGAVPTTSLRDAVMRIGLRGLRDVAMAAALESTFRSGPLGQQIKQEAKHAFAVACGTAAIAPKLRVSPEYAFLCGLMHDVGRIALLAAMGDFSESERRWLHPEFVDSLLDNYHQEVGARVLQRWKMPPLTIDVAQRHHDIGIEDSAVNRMRNAVAVADTCADAADSGEEERVLKLQAHEATLALSIPDRVLERLIEKVDEALAAMD